MRIGNFNSIPLKNTRQMNKQQVAFKAEDQKQKAFQACISDYDNYERKQGKLSPEEESRGSQNFRNLMELKPSPEEMRSFYNKTAFKNNKEYL